MYCFFCQEKIDLNKETSSICSLCAESRTTYRWPSAACLRCGDCACTGCEKLSCVAELFCLYSYEGWPALLLRLAKESNHVQGIQIFCEVFYSEIKDFLIKILRQKNYNIVFLSPIRKERLVKNQWHPYFLFERIIEDVQQDLKNIHIISTGKIKNYHKQAHLNLKQRVLKMHRDSSADMAWFLDQKPLRKVYEKGRRHLAQHWLVIDDVLTTGATLEKLCHAIKHDFPFVELDIITLFRTPLTKGCLSERALV